MTKLTDGQTNRTSVVTVIEKSGGERNDSCNCDAAIAAAAAATAAKDAADSCRSLSEYLNLLPIRNGNITNLSNGITNQSTDCPLVINDDSSFVKLNAAVTELADAVVTNGTKKIEE